MTITNELRLFIRFLRTTRGKGGWIKELQGVIADLETLNRTTEDDFLEVGGNLMAFLSASRQLHSEIAGLTALVSGEHAQHACEALVSVRGFVREMKLCSQNDGRAFADLRHAAASIHRRFSTLGKIALSFQITAILARIETAHLAGSKQDLGSLADEVASCGAGIQSRAEQVLEATAAFDSRVSSTLREVSRLDAIQQKEIPSLLAAVDADLELFETRQREAAGASARLAADLNSVTQDLAAIATSIQFHDITRQQVEHVIEALTGLRDTPGGILTQSGVNLTQLQKAQLEGAASSFKDSTQKIGRELEDIAARVAEMAAAGRRILGSDQKDTFLSEMQHRFADILRIVGESLSLGGTARRITAELDDLSRRLSASVDEVQTLELQLSRISINAAISASHIGVAGDPLNIVAGAMQGLQNECAARSSEARTDLDSIAKALACLSANGLESTSNVSGAELLDNLDKRLGDLRSTSALSVDAAGVIAARGDTLCENLREARSRFAVGRLFDETMDRCCGALDGVGAHVSEPLWSRHPAASVAGHDHRYTMQSEREVHKIVVSGARAEPVAAVAGDDVEFF